MVVKSVSAILITLTVAPSTAAGKACVCPKSQNLQVLMRSIGSGIRVGLRYSEFTCFRNVLNPHRLRRKSGKPHSVITEDFLRFFSIRTELHAAYTGNHLPQGVKGKPGAREEILDCRSQFELSPRSS